MTRERRAPAGRAGRGLAGGRPTQVRIGNVVEFRFRCNDWSPTVPRRYEYKFLVDGREWWNDPEAPKTPNVWGSENSDIDGP